MSASTSSKPSSISSEEWQVLEASAQKMGSTLVSYLKNVVKDVNSIIDNQEPGIDAKFGRYFGKRSSSDSSDNVNDERTSTESHNIDQNFKFFADKIDYQGFINRMRDPRASALRHSLQSFCKAFMEGRRVGGGGLPLFLVFFFLPLVVGPRPPPRESWHRR
mmetsp:Transcript_27748/g.73280  ORF Transcript_27748/g.73280 Transcript_27748/m.73280 type:complete len:162 (-) Transcript_27748:25-510(-)